MERFFSPRVGLFLLLFWIGSMAAIEPLPEVSVFTLASAGITALAEDNSLLEVNPAAAGSGISTSALIINSQSNLSLLGLNACLRAGNLGFGLGCKVLENPDYQIQTYHFAGKTGGKIFTIGVGIKTAIDNIEGYGGAQESWLYAGVRSQLGRVTIDVQKDNLMLSKSPPAKKSRQMSGSLACKLQEKAVLGAGVELLKDNSAEFKIGGRFILVPNAEVYLAWEAESARYSSGLLLRRGRMQLLYGIRTHPELDWTHALGLSYSL